MQNYAIRGWREGPHLAKHGLFLAHFEIAVYGAPRNSRLVLRKNRLDNLDLRGESVGAYLDHFPVIPTDSKTNMPSIYKHITMTTSMPASHRSRSRIQSARRFAFITMGAVIALPLAAISQTSAPWVAPSGAAAKKNPFAGKADAAASGKQLYTTTCAPCHGTTGRGDGPAAVALNPRPANYTTSAISAESDGSLFWKLSEGRGAMVPFKSALSEKQRWELITYIRTLQKKK